MSVPTGTIISGTLRRPDLINEFLGFIKDHSYGDYLRLIDSIDTVKVIEIEEDDDWYNCEEASCFLFEDIYEVMEALAPDGYYFGAHPGDGSDFGYWENEDDSIGD